jgi:hypothetical protein
MPTVRRRRRVYFDYSYTRRMRMEGLLSVSIYISAGIFFLSALVCLPEMLSGFAGWLLPRPLFSLLGNSGGEQGSLLTTFCAFLMAVSGIYLVAALFIRFQARH